MYKPIREFSAENILNVAMLHHLAHKDTLEVSPTPSPQPPSPPAQHTRSRSSQPEPPQSTQHATSKPQYTYDQTSVPRDTHEAFIQQTMVNIKMLHLLENMSRQLSRQHQML